MTGDALPPFERYTQYRRYMDVAFHPSGDLLYSCDLTGQYNLWSQPILAHGLPGYPRPWTYFADRSVRSICPMSDGNSILVTADQNGDEQYQILRVWLDGRGVETISEAPEVQHFLTQGDCPSSAPELLYTDNGRRGEDMDVVLRHWKTGKVTRPFPEGEYWADPRFDPTRHRILAIQARSNRESHVFVLDRRRNRLEEILPHTGDGYVLPVDWTWDGTGVLLVSDVGREFRCLELYQFAKHESKLLAAPDHDVEFVDFAPAAGVIAYAVNEDGYSTIYAGRIGQKLDRLRAPRGTVLLVPWGNQFAVSRDGRQVAALWDTGQAPPEILRLPVGGAEVTFVTNGMVGGVPDAPVPIPKLVKIPRASGKPIPAFWYLPKRRVKGRFGAVLSIHGGPEWQERPGWSSGGLYPFLNSRGIAVLAPNVRGSTGYGKSYQRMIYRDWGGGELEDLRLCAEWLKTRPEVDPQRLAVYGGSFGGFATLSCLTRLPQYWKAGVDIFGPSNLVSFVRSVPPSWRRFMDELVGNPEKDREALLARSPLSHLEQLRADVLIIQGAKDPRVVKDESDQIVARLRAAGRPVEYLVFENEGHGFTHTENMVRAFRTTTEFLVPRIAPPPS